MRLADKVAIVTGSTYGIGRATAILFAREGAKVVVSGRTVEAGQKVADAIKSEGGQATFVRADVAQARDVENLVATAVRRYGKLDVLFNNAGIVSRGKLADEPEESWDRCVDIDLKGVFLGIKYAVPEMKKSGGGSIVNNASMWGMVASQRGGASYAAAKGGVIMLTRQAALNYGRDNIRVNCVSPGDIAMVGTERTEEYWRRPEVIKDWSSRQPVPKMGDVWDVAYCVLFLASDEAAFVSGANLVVDGGLTVAEALQNYS